MSKYNILFLFTIFITIKIIKNDLPVHCVLQDITGEWVFRVSKETYNPKINDIKTTCGHGIPIHSNTFQGNI
jgi:hypothetical protein